MFFLLFFFGGGEYLEHTGPLGPYGYASSSQLWCGFLAQHILQLLINYFYLLYWTFLSLTKNMKKKRKLKKKKTCSHTSWLAQLVKQSVMTHKPNHTVRLGSNLHKVSSLSVIKGSGTSDRSFMGWTHWAISRSSQCSTTGVTKAVVCVILSVGWCI